MNVEYVEFPAIGLRVPVSRTLFTVFGYSIYTYAVIIAFAILLMIYLGLRQSERYGIPQDTIIDFMIFALPASIVCARIYYVIFSWDVYKDNLLSVFNIRQGGIAIYGAVIGAFLTVVVFSKLKKLDALRFLDFGTPYLLLAQGIGRWGNFINQEAFGSNTTLPWGMTSPQIVNYLVANTESLSAQGMEINPAVTVHPTFLYESLWNIVVACFLFKLRKRMKFKGEVLLSYLIGYGIGRAFIEGLRTDSLMLGGIRISQLVSILLVVLCVVLYLAVRNKAPRYEVPIAGVGAAAVVMSEEDGAALGAGLAGAGAVADGEEADTASEPDDASDVDADMDTGADTDNGTDTDMDTDKD